MTRPLRVDLKKAYAAFVTVCLVWGTTYLAIKIALDTIPPFLMGGLRYVTAGLLLSAFLWWRGCAMPNGAGWGRATVSGLLLLGIGNGGVIWAEKWVPTGLTAVLVAATPFWMVGIEALLPSGERLTRQSVLGLIVGFAGIVLLVWPDLTTGGGGSGFLAGIVALQLATLGWALGTAYSRRQKASGEPFVAAAAQMLTGGLGMLALGTIWGEWASLGFTPRTGAALGYLIVMGSLVGFAAFIYALSQLPTSFVSLYAYVNPVVAVALGALVLGETVGWRLVVAIAVILSGMAIVSMRGPGEAASEAERKLVASDSVIAPPRTTEAA
jgi:drug/metabolite transporter (DMT)-like permease